MKKVVSYCDICEWENALTHTITINGKTVVVDLCEKHTKEWLTEPLEYFIEIGRASETASLGVGRGAKKGRVYQEIKCEEPECDKVVRGNAALTAHKRAVHPIKKKVVSLVPKEKTNKSISCTEKDCAATFDTPQGMSLHRFRAHGVKASSLKVS